MTTHLLLGGSGFVGRNVAAVLAARGDAVIVAGRRLPAALPQGARFVDLDFPRQDWGHLLRDCDVVHHYVWSTGPHAANENPLADLDDNLRGTVRLLEAMRLHPGKPLLFSSSGGTVYGKLLGAAACENHPLNPVSAYGASKVAAEKYIGFYRAQHGVDGRVARIANPFGAASGKRNQGVVQVFLAQALAGEILTIWGDGSVVRDYLHISDVAEALVKMADAPAVAGTMPVFNIGSGEGRSQNQIVSAVTALLGAAPRVVYQSGRPFDVPVSILDISKARNELSWTPHLSFQDGLRRTLAEMKG
jgi:UDP-glucose 4-epimerase